MEGCADRMRISRWLVADPGIPGVSSASRIHQESIGMAIMEDQDGGFQAPADMEVEKRGESGKGTSDRRWRPSGVEGSSTMRQIRSGGTEMPVWLAAVRLGGRRRV